MFTTCVSRRPHFEETVHLGCVDCHGGDPNAATKDVIAAMAVKGYWTSPGGKTPEATLYSAMLRKISTKGAASRFVKTDRGKFARTGVA
jgi:hypothetical protein